MEPEPALVAACKRAVARSMEAFARSQIGFGGAGFRRLSLCAFQRGVGARDVNLFGAFGNFREDDDAIRQHFGEAVHHGEIARLAALAGRR